MPGGAPLKKKRKKPASKKTTGKKSSTARASTKASKSSSSSTKRKPSAPAPSKGKRDTSSSGARKKPREKPPCKYGPRDADGYCPKKPKATKATKPEEKKGLLDKPIPQGYTATGKKRAPTTVRKEAKKVLEKAVTETATEAAKRTYAAYKKDPERFKGAAAELIATMTKWGFLGAVIAGTIAVGLKVGTGAREERDAEAERRAFDALTRVKSDLIKRGQWKQEYASMLIPQYREFFRTQLSRINQSGGK